MVASFFFNGPNLLLIEIQKQTCKKNFMNVPQELPFFDLPIWHPLWGYMVSLAK